MGFGNTPIDVIKTGVQVWGLQIWGWMVSWVGGGGEGEKKVPMLLTGAFGSTTSAASVFDNFPIDVIKTHLQV